MRRRKLLLAGALSVLVGLLLAGAGNTATARDEPARALRAQLPDRLKYAKLDSRLAAVAKVDAQSGTGAALATARARGLKVKGGRVRAVIVGRDRGAAEGAAVAHGAKVEARYGKLVQVLLPPAAIEGLSRNPNVEYVRPQATARPDAIPGEGVVSTGAAPWHAAGRLGAGTKVAVIDLGFAGFTARQAEGELPASPTTVDLCDGEFATEEPHGTAVAEIVHEMAPAAELTLICIDSEVTLGEAEEYVKANGIRIVNHSVGWFNVVRGDGNAGAGTIDGIVADARANGVLWVNSVGNQAEDHWSGTYNDSDGTGFHNYTSTDEGNTFLVPGGSVACVTLKWDSWPTTNQDFDLYIARSWDGALFAASTNLQNGTQAPTEEACFVNPGGDDYFFLAIDRFAGTAKPRFDAFVFGGYLLQYVSAAGSVNELAASPNTLAVAALCWQTNALESFSSRGPTISGLLKPDISGPDGVSGATYGGTGSCGSGGFLGTSASSPHVAGAAALVLGKTPGLSVTALQSALTSSAVDMGTTGKDNSFGAGRLRVPPILAPVVSSFTPSAATAGTTVTLSGSSFTGANAVAFNGVPASGFTYVSATQVKAVVPPTATVGPIRVTTPDGAGQSAADFKPLPKLTLATPNPAQAGDALTLTGSNLAAASALKLGTLTLPLDSVAAEEVHTTLPATGGLTNNLTLTTPAGTSAGLKLNLRPTISSFTPLTAPAGTQITIDGQTFSGTTKVTFGQATASATFSVVNTTQLRATVPSGAVSGPITVTNAGGATTSAASFGLLPKVSSFSPTSGIAGTEVTITGTGFAGATGVTFNGVASTSVTSITPTSLKAKVPPGATSGPIVVLNSSGSGASASTFTVPLAITSFSPTSGLVGTSVTIHGSGFSNAIGVKFGDLTANGSIDSDTQITAIVPDGAVTAPITVGTGTLSVTSTTPFTVTLPPPPVIADVGTLGGNLCGGFSSAYSIARAINADGEVAGDSCKLVGFQYESHPFHWSDDELTDLGTSGAAYGIDDAGRVVGGTGGQFSESSGNAFLWSGGTLTNLGPVLGGFSRALDISNGGKVVGYRGTPPNVASWSAFVYDTGTQQVTSLTGLGGTFRSAAYAINDSGQIAGYASTVAENEFHAVRWSGGVPLDLGTLGGTHSFATGINSAGDVVGRSYMPGDSAEHAFLYSGGSMVDLGTLAGSQSSAYGINDSGDVVGWSASLSGGSAFLYRDDELIDLNDCLPPGSGWVLREAWAISNAGKIVGAGQRNGATHGFVLDLSLASC